MDYTIWFKEKIMGQGHKDVNGVCTIEQILSFLYFKDLQGAVVYVIEAFNVASIEVNN
jgi:hypothetical protein